MSSNRKKSELWQFFTPENNDVASCDFCKKKNSFKTSVSNLKKHLIRVHPTVQISGSSLNNPTTTSIILPSTSKNATVVTTPNEPTPKTVSKTINPISNFLTPKMTQTQKKKINEAFLQLFYKDIQPFSIVEDQGFRNFVSLLNPSFVIPSRKYISKTLIPAAYEKCLNSTKTAASDIVVKGVCITTDGWTSRNNQCFVAVTAHFIDDNFFLKTVLLECAPFQGSHTADAISRHLQRIIREWQFENKITLAVSDNAANYVSAISDKLKWKHWGCFAHTLNLIVNKSLEPVQNILRKVKNIVTFFRKSSVASEKLNESQKSFGALEPKKLVQEVETRWNSTFYMVERFVELENSVKTALALLNTELEGLSSNEWIVLKEMTEVLKPFERATVIVSGEKYMSASLVIVLSAQLSEVCVELSKKEFKEETKNVLSYLSTGLYDRLGNVEMSTTLSICTFLDPRFKTLPFRSQSAIEKVKSNVTGLVKEIIKEHHEETTTPSLDPETTQSDDEEDDCL